jgi:hypothetical protein
MAEPIIKECQGYTKEEAFANLRFNPNSPIIKGANATQAWNLAGRPTIGTAKFKQFAIEQLADKTKFAPGYGIHIVLDSNMEDKRKRPYSVINNKTIGTREWKFKYQIREDIITVEQTEYSDDETGLNITVAERGMVVEECDSKAEALEIAKQLTAINHKDYSIVAIKVPDIAPISAFVLYTPSKNAKMGTFIACGINEEVVE